MTLRRVFLVLLVSFACRRQCASAIEETTMYATERTPTPGCAECGDYRCPEDSKMCLLGSVPDSCGCCSNGVCARLDGESCWNSSINGLSVKNRYQGFCARNYLCQLRNDLHDEDEPEAICVCMEQTPACGNDNQTYGSPCALHEKAMAMRSSSLKLQHLGPCSSRPWILSPLSDVSSTSGQHIVLICEVKGFPPPDIFWEFHSVDETRILKLPNEEHESTVSTNEGPEPLMRTSWLQIARLEKKHAGTYLCIANNSIGEAETGSNISIL